MVIDRIKDAAFSQFWYLYPEYRDGERTISVGQATATFPVESSERAWGVSPAHGPGPGGEAVVLREFIDAIQPGDIVWDVGAYWGLFTCFAADCVGDGAVVAFEPDSGRVAELRASIARNDETAVDIREIALSDVDGSVPLLDNQAAGPSADTAESTVRTRRADSLFSEGAAIPDVLKIDVEGVEANVLEGFGAHLAEVRCVIVELHPDKLRDFGQDRERVETLLSDAGFDVAEVGGTGNTTLHAR